MNKTIKAISVLLIAAMMLFTISTTVFAVDPNGIISNMNNVNNVDTNSISTIGGQIANILSTIGIIVGVIVLLVLGIKYMMGSTSEKAEYKKTMIPYLVGIVLLLGASGIVKAIASFKLGYLILQPYYNHITVILKVHIKCTFFLFYIYIFRGFLL